MCFHNWFAGASLGLLPWMWLLRPLEPCLHSSSEPIPEARLSQDHLLGRTGGAGRTGGHAAHYGGARKPRGEREGRESFFLSPKTLLWNLA